MDTVRKDFVIGYFGSEAKVARALGIQRPSVNKWPEMIPLSAVGRLALKHPKCLAEYRKTCQRNKCA